MFRITLKGLGRGHRKWEMVTLAPFYKLSPEYIQLGWGRYTWGSVCVCGGDRGTGGAGVWCFYRHKESQTPAFMDTESQSSFLLGELGAYLNVILVEEEDGKMVGASNRVTHGRGAHTPALLIQREPPSRLHSQHVLGTVNLDFLLASDQGSCLPLSLSR